MSDESRGPGWWMASDGKWYPPESRPAAMPPPPPPSAVTVPAGSNSSAKMLPEQWAVVGSAVVVFIGALLPWASLTTGFGTASRSGISDGGDGLFTLILGVIGAVSAWRPGKGGVWIAVGCGALITGVGIWDAKNISETDLEVGGGLYLTILGGVVMFAAGLTAWDKRRNKEVAVVGAVVGEGQRVDGGPSKRLVRPWIAWTGIAVLALIVAAGIFGD